MQFITGNNRHQTFFSTLKENLSFNNVVRLIDAFIDKHDLMKMDFTKTIYKGGGRDFFTYGCKRNVSCAMNQGGVNYLNF